MSFEEIPEQTEDVPLRPIMWTLLVTLITIAASAVIVWALAAFQLYGGGRSDIAQPAIVVPPFEPFEDQPTILEAERASERQRLDSWAWADPQRRIVALPVDVAIDRYLETRGWR